MEPWIGLFRLRVDDEALAEEHGWEADRGGYAWFAALAPDYQGFVDAVRDAVALQGLRIDDVADADALTTRREQESLSPLVTGLASAVEATGGVWSGTWHLYPLDAPDEEEPLEIDKLSRMRTPASDTLTGSRLTNPPPTSLKRKKAPALPWKLIPTGIFPLPS
jgi:hypothetical protein